MSMPFTEPLPTTRVASLSRGGRILGALFSQPPDHSEREPCDHIGTLLMLVAWLAEAGREHDVDCLLAWHLLPWSGRFLEVFIAEARHPFYVALGELTRLTLAAWRSDLPIPVAQKTLWR